MLVSYAHPFRTTVVIVLALVVAPIALAEVNLFVYGGKAYTHDSDVDLKRPPGTDLTFKDVSWDDKSFTSPPYWGARVGYWFERAPEWGLALDYIHAKIVARLEDSVEVSGNRAGTTVAGAEKLSETFGNLQFSDGYNLLMLNGQYRIRLDPVFQPYVGLGAGVAVPHVEIEVDGTETRGYQLAGPAGQALAGLGVNVGEHLVVFGEYKFSVADLEADLDNGGTVETTPLTHHFVIGGGVRF